MRIGIVTNWFERGAGYLSKAYEKALSPNHQVFIYARGGDPRAGGRLAHERSRRDPAWQAPNVAWGPWVRARRGTGVAWRHFRRWAEGNKLDVIMFVAQEYWAPVVLARRHLKARLVNVMVEQYTQETVPYLSLFDALFCNARMHWEVFRWHERAWYIPWGTDCFLFTGDCKPVHPGKVVFFHAPGLSPGRKGTLTSLKAFHDVEGACRFVLHLQAPIAEFPEIARACAADSRIQVVNKSVPPPGLFNMGDVYVYPSILEGIGLSVPEALASGLPVITTDAPPMNEFVTPGENGLLVRPTELRGRPDGYYWPECFCSPDGVREAMQYYVDNRARLEEFKRQARESALTRMDWSRNAAELPALLERIPPVVSRKDLRELEVKALDYCRKEAPMHKDLAQFVWRKLGMTGSAFLDHLIYA